MQYLRSILLTSCALLSCGVNVSAADPQGESEPKQESAAPPRDGQAEAQKQLTKSLNIQAKGMTVRYPEGWSVAPTRFANAPELVYSPGEKSTALTAAEGAVRAAILAIPPRITVTSERRLDHADAVRRLKEIEAEEPSPSTFLEIGGWPALQRRHLAPRQRPGRPRAQTQESGTTILRMTTAVAVGDRLIRLEGSLPPEAAPALAAEVELIGRRLSFDTKGSPDQVEKDLQKLRAGPSLRSSLLTPRGQAPRSSVGGPAAVRKAVAAAAPAGSPVKGGRNFTPFPGPQDFSDLAPGVPQRVLNSGSEIEVAASPNGQNVVVATNGGYSFSNDGGTTFTQSGLATPPGFFSINGDPSLAVGLSGNFYYAIIGFPNGSAGAPTTNSTAMYVSTDNGQNFNFRANAVLCNAPFVNGAPTFPNPGDCFADQEHIAADRFNAGAGGGDQVYSTWRNFDATDQDPALVCSQDSGQNWTAPINVGTGFIPRVNVGQDGFVYVIFRTGGNIMLNKFSSCANGLAAQAGFPRMVDSVTDVCTEKLPGIDRCDGRNSLSSHTVAVDDTNANHVFATYATHTGAGNENVLVRDSADGGLTWPAADVVQVNAAVAGRRFMPWICSIGGTAHVTWYDRRAATGANNDLTDFYRASAARSGGALTAGAETRITDASDPHCQTGFPCSSDDPNDAETCATQPQLWGICKLSPVPNPDTSSNAPCDFSANNCAASGEVCTTFGGGCPKYGDYNGNTCAAGRIYSAWAASTSPTNVAPATPSNRIDTFFDSTLVCCVPRIQTPASVTLPATCAGDTGTTTLTVSNTGLADLIVSGISSSNPRFSVSGPFPRTIAAGASFAFTVNFSPLIRGPQSATLTVSSNDPVNPTVTVAASGLGKGLQNIICPANVTANTTPGLCTAVVNLGTPTVNADGCPVVVNGVRSDGLPLASPFPKGTTTVTWTATDGGGNSQSCQQTVTVNDVEPPVIICPADIDAFSDPGQIFATLTIAPATATDNCPGVSVSGTRSDGRPLTDTYPVGTTTITWKATDASGNTATCVQTIKVRTLADLQVVFSPEPNPVRVGNFLTYRVEITNLGPSPAFGVTLTDQLPGDVVLTSLTAVAGPPGSCSGNPNVTCTWERLDQFQGAVVLMVVQTLTPGLTSNKVSVGVNTSLTLDPQPANNSQIKHTNVIR